MTELLLIDKPKGITSFDVIRILRKKFRSGLLGTGLSVVQGASEDYDQAVSGNTAREQTSAATQKCANPVPKMGHAGTLDPLATGLMIIGVGRGTKKLQEYLKLDKEYEAEILVGERRSTGDMEGEVLDERSVEEIFSEEKISSTLATMIGTLTLPVSAYSAIKKDGMPMYKRARAAAKEGRQIEDVPVREMVVHEAELLALEFHTINRMKKLIVKVRFKVGSGTYIRSLAEEFGKRLGSGYPATLKNLRRTKVGEFRVEDSITLE